MTRGVLQEEKEERVYMKENIRDTCFIFQHIRHRHSPVHSCNGILGILGGLQNRTYTRDADDEKRKQKLFRVLGNSLDLTAIALCAILSREVDPDRLEAQPSM